MRPQQTEAVQEATTPTTNILHRPVKFWAPVLDLSEKTLREAVRAGALGHVRIGDRVLISLRHIEAWLAANERKPRGRKAA